MNDLCLLCAGPGPLWRLADGRGVCRRCLAKAREYTEGWRLCPHGYLQVCYRCGRGFDDKGVMVS